MVILCFTIFLFILKRSIEVLRLIIAFCFGPPNRGEWPSTVVNSLDDPVPGLPVHPLNVPQPQVRLHQGGAPMCQHARQEHLHQ